MQHTKEAHRIGLVLSGGGVRGMAHIGLIQALLEAGIRPSQVAGTSVGALVGALYAAGVPVEGMLAFFRETPLFKYNYFTINKPGLMDTERYFDVFKAYFPEDTFEALEIPLHVTTTNLLKGRLEIFSSGPLIRPLLASAAIPPVFSPVRIGKDLYGDGGIMNNFPSEPLQESSDFIIGSNVSMIREIPEQQLRTSLQLTNRTTALMIYSLSRDKLRECDLLFEPKDLDRIGVLDKKGLEQAYQIGYSHARDLVASKLREDAHFITSLVGRK